MIEGLSPEYFTAVELLIIGLFVIVAALTAALAEAHKKIRLANNRITDLKMEMRIAILESETRSLDAIAGVDRSHTLAMQRHVTPDDEGDS